MNEVTVFSNEEFGKVRTLTIKNEPWFVGKDVADVLGYQNGSRDVNRHVEEEDRQTVEIFDGTQRRKVKVINESGLYSLILSSDLPKAKEFKHWITSEVLPSIRKTGAYSLSGNDEYSKKSTSVGEVASLIKTLRGVMKDQKSKPRKIAVMAKTVCDQFGINLPDKFVEEKHDSGQMYFSGFPEEE